PYMNNGALAGAVFCFRSHHTPASISYLNRDRELSLRRERPEHALDQRGIAIFLDLLDLAVLDAPYHAVLIVVSHPGLGDVVAAGFDDNVITFRDEVERQRARPHGEERPEMTHQTVV